MIAACFPLPGGTLLLPRLVSDHEHAPYFAEISILHQLSILPNKPRAEKAALAPIPLCTWYVLSIEAAALAVLLFICKRLLIFNNIKPTLV